MPIVSLARIQESQTNMTLHPVLMELGDDNSKNINTDFKI